MSKVRRSLGRWILVAVALWLGGVAFGQGLSLSGGAEYVDVGATIEPATARRGETVELRVTVTIEPGWYIYSMTPVEAEFGPAPTTIRVEAEGLEPLGPFVQPPPIRKFDEAFQMEVESFKGEVTFTQRFRVTERASLGEIGVTAFVRFQVCSDRVCMPPTTLEAPTTLTIEEGPPRPAYTTAEAPSEATRVPSPPSSKTPSSKPSGGTASQLEKARANGLFAYLGFAFSMGLLALLTPCVFPMIPITVSFFTKKEGLSRRQGIAQAFIYSGGIIGTFTGLGILLALLFGAAAIQGVASNVWVNLFIAGIFIVFALNLFGAFEIRVPHRLLNALGSKSGEGTGTLGTLLMGLTFSLTTFTCTVPFVGTVLVAATQGEIFWAVAGMLAFSAAFASPFFFLALFPQLLASMPQSGGWLNSVKVTLGFLELAAALKFLSNIDLVMGWGILPRELFLSAWIAIALIAGIYLLGKIRLPLDTPVETLGVPRLLFSVVFFAIAFYLLTGLFGKPLGEIDAFLPPYSTGGGVALSAGIGSGETAKVDEEEWLEDYEEALAEAKRTNRPIFIDFTGVTCTNCRWMEKNIFPKPEVAPLLKQYVRVQLWTDKPTPESRANQQMQLERFGTVALPFYALMTPDDTVIATFDGLTRDPKEFAAFLRGGLDAFAEMVATR